MIVTITPNPMLDKMLWLPRLEYGHTHRASRLHEISGGKGLNVSRALLQLGESTLATGFLGGYTGTAIRRLLDAEKIPHAFIEIAATTRTGFTVVETENHRHTAVFEPGHQLQPEEVRALLTFVKQMLPQCRALALCGSMPCAGFDHLYADLIQLARARHVPVFLDSYHAPLRLGLAAGPQFLKPNRDELLATFGLDMREAAQQHQALRLLAASGASHVFITDGERPVHILAEGAYYRAVPPAITCVNPLGSGDALVAAFLHGWLQHLPVEALLRFAVAAGSVNAGHTLPGYANPAEITALAAQVRLERIGNFESFPARNGNAAGAKPDH
ncbi:MAG: 1-phosphofructokinase family hexose kinase [candidate division KSB1 bacterium]|nr:1-phosphofructokinase family hexose kinase [candidate division KSB1 bacterium]MDZ7275021.1 1-phosphofructokinase family hexose kinase [candidate division KSB1 bacterium]MDZ7286530.1 1-phosphofructokinase family hexose kinase [candidate division KSB1 bacterium]MDZ7299306.1 1-phosphofructokinase family hexose kinase [candidate division KSB1 bacterium]MDZ7306977.1 1-phosphofructokinase family hexose kinase [candidate division KSB1 bacterium]